MDATNHFVRALPDGNIERFMQFYSNCSTFSSISGVVATNTSNFFFTEIANLTMLLPQINNAITALTNSSSAPCHNNTLLLSAFATNDALTVQLPTLTTLTDCAAIQQPWLAATQDGWCDDVITGAYYMWIAQFATSGVLFFVICVASLLKEYYVELTVLTCYERDKYKKLHPESEQSSDKGSGDDVQKDLAESKGSDYHSKEDYSKDDNDGNDSKDSNDNNETFNQGQTRQASTTLKTPLQKHHTAFGRHHLSSDDEQTNTNAQAVVTIDNDHSNRKGSLFDMSDVYARSNDSNVPHMFDKAELAVLPESAVADQHGRKGSLFDMSQVYGLSRDSNVATMYDKDGIGIAPDVVTAANNKNDDSKSKSRKGSQFEMNQVYDASRDSNEQTMFDHNTPNNWPQLTQSRPLSIDTDFGATRSSSSNDNGQNRRSQRGSVFNINEVYKASRGSNDQEMHTMTDI